MAELLLELLSEEIPARMQRAAAQDLCALTTARLTRAGLSFTEARAYATPRRLALVVTGLPEKQPDLVEEKKGPRPEAPEQAIQGFLRSNGLRSLKQAQLRETDKGTFYFAVKRVPGQAAAKVLPALINEAVQAMPWPKSMRWPGSQLRWVRPLHGALGLFGGRALPGGVQLGEGASLRFATATPGHRFLAPKPVAVKDFADYAAKLRKAKVVFDPAERRAAILRQAERAAAKAQLALKDDPALLDEVTGLVEWPVVLMGRIDEAFMSLPPEVLTTAMRAHQKYLALLDKQGRPANRFLLVANMETRDKGKAIVAGNERVLRARLADARFFWDQDRKVPLAKRGERLGEITFHAALGTLADKVRAIESLAVQIAASVPGAEKDRVRSAARLAKADLTTGMVGEFPELQGVMGRYYALADGEHAEVAQAIAEHYAPLGPNDACPSAPVSVAVALADKIDTLFWFFAIGEKPTGSKDPYALRRAALGVIRLIVENRLRLPLSKAFDVASSGRPIALDTKGRESGWQPVAEELLEFLADRLKVVLRDTGVRHDLIAAVFALGGEDDLVRLLERVRTLERFLASDDGANLLTAFKRANNIVRIEEEKDGREYDGDDVRPELLREEAEKKLNRALDKVLEIVVQARDEERYGDAFSAFAGLRSPIDRFFDTVRVNTSDTELRENRLRFLDKIRSRFLTLADFSKIEG